jgi:putative spermidine/putrescine transport system permease protein
MLQRRGLLLGLAAPGILLFTFFFAIPLFSVSWDAVTAAGAFERVLSNPLFTGGLANSAYLTVVSAGGSLVVGLLVALHLSRLSERWRTLLAFFIALPLTFSGLIIAYGFILAYGRAGFITQILAFVGMDPASFAQLLFSPTGLAFTCAYYLIPRVVMLLLPVLVNFDWSQITAAESLGATRRGAIVQILIPQILPTAFSAFCLIAAVVFGAYGTALALVGTQVNILPLQLYSMISESGTDFPAAAALALILTAICSSMMAVGELVVAGRERRDANA